MSDNRLNNTLILLIDGDPQWYEQLRRAFADGAGSGGADEDSAGLVELGEVRLVVAEDLQAARRRLETLLPALVIANLQLPDGSGLDLLVRDTLSYPVIVTSDKPGEALAVKAMQAGAMDYLVKPASTAADLVRQVRAALYEWRIMLEHRRLQIEVAEMPEREQQRIGRELHDGLGQQLTGLGLLAKSLARRLANASEREMAEQLADGLEQALAEVRTLAHGLLPVHADARGLVSALEELAARVSRQSGIRVELRHEDPMLVSDNETAIHVYRIVQEAINNAVKHAQADNIVLTLETDEHQAVIEVRDNGRGLPEGVKKKAGLGLRTMFHRCQLFGGSLDIYTHDDGGTRVRCCFPLHAVTPVE